MKTCLPKNYQINATDGLIYAKLLNRLLGLLATQLFQMDHRFRINVIVTTASSDVAPIIVHLDHLPMPLMT
jgi:hypothetical protein